MCFINQRTKSKFNEHQDENENNCGAFSIAYYLHLKGAVCLKDDAGSWKLIHEIYTQVKFGESFQAMPSYSSPEKMVEFLTKHNHESKFIADIKHANEAMRKILEMMKIEYTNKSMDISDGSYGIIVCYDCSSVQRLHYVLIQKKGGKYRLWDPNNGKEMTAAEISIGKAVYDPAPWCYSGGYIEIKN